MDVFEELPDNSRHRHGPPPLPQALGALDQLLATQNALMKRLVVNKEHWEAPELLQQQQPCEMSYSDFLVTHPPVFIDATDPLEADSWLRITEAKFDLLRYSEVQKTLFTA
jgi:hypothetical protein